MERWKTNLLLLWLSQILVVVGYAAALPFIPLFISERYGVSDERTLGLIVSWFHFISTGSFAIMAPIWGRLADHYGRKIMLLRACFMDAIIFPLMVYAPNITVLFILRILASMFTGTTSAAQPLIVSGTPKQYHGFALGLLSTALWSGNMLGYLFGGLIVHRFGFTAAFMFCGFTYFLSGIIVLFVHEDFKPVTKSVPQRKASFFSMGANIWIILSLILLLGFIRSFELPYLPQLVKRITGEQTAAFWTGIVCAGAALGGVIAGAICGYLADRTPATRIIFPALLLGSAALLWQTYAASTYSLIAARFVAYLAIGGIGPIFLTLITKVTDKDKQGLVFGMNTTAENTGIMLSALFSGGVIYYAGVRGVFATASLLCLLFIPYVFFANSRIKHRN